MAFFNTISATQARQRTQITPLFCLLMVVVIWPMSGNTAGDRHFTHRAEDGVVTFSDAPMRGNGWTRRTYGISVKKPTAANPCKGLSSDQLSAKGRELDSLIINAAAKFSIDPALIKAVARAESCFDSLAVSRAGAVGLMQLMPATAKDMGVLNVLDPNQNLTGGARYLAAMLARYAEDTHKALAAYNAGPGNVDKYNGVPPFPETKRYIVAVQKFRKLYAPQFSRARTIASNP